MWLRFLHEGLHFLHIWLARMSVILDCGFKFWTSACFCFLVYSLGILVLVVVFWHVYCDKLFGFPMLSSFLCLICMKMTYWILMDFWISQVKSRAMEVAKLIENEDGVAAAVDAFHRHLPQEVPLPRPLPLENDHPNTIQWVFIQIGKICCLPCNS